MTHVRDIDYHGVTVKNLTDEVRLGLRDWRRGVLDRTPVTKYGLWLFGERGAGTSYVGKAIAGRMFFQEEGFLGAFRVSATELMQRTRNVWSMEQQMRHNSDDLALFYDSRDAEEILDRYYKVSDLLWIDDLHDETIEMPFWRRHVQGYVEERVKNKLATIVSTTLPPDDDSLPKRVIADLFQVVYCDGYRPEVDAYPWPGPSDGEG